MDRKEEAEFCNVSYWWDHENMKHEEKTTRMAVAKSKLDDMVSAFNRLNLGTPIVKLDEWDARTFYKVLVDAGVEHSIIITRRWFFGGRVMRLLWLGVTVEWDFEDLIHVVRTQRARASDER